MSCFETNLKQLVVDLYNVNGIKLGKFKTKIGLMTPIYVDLRVIVSHPKLMESLADLITEQLKTIGKHDLICGVPYTALPIATTVSAKTGIPMVMRRKEAKFHGTKQLIEGCFKAGDLCLIVEDVVLSGSSILETVRDLADSGVHCTDAIMLLNREQGGENILKENGISIHALLTMTKLVRILREENCVGDDTVECVLDYIKSTKVDSNAFKKPDLNRLKLTYESRIQYATNPITTQLLQIMITKQTNLCVAADVTRTTDLLNLAEQIGPHVCLLKTHIDILDDFHPNFLKHLQSVAESHNFMLFEDRKFSDIGQTVQLQYSKGVYKISSWAPIVTAHSVFGRGVLEGLKSAEGLSQRGVFLLAEGSVSGCLMNEAYRKSTLQLADEYADLVVGIVCQSPLFLDKPGFVQLTPGVQLGVAKDGLEQQYSSPESVVLERGADVAVVGRGITQSPEPGVAAEKYRKLLWDAYVKRIF